MRVEYDASADMTYIYLVDRIAPGEAVRQVPAEDNTAVLDYDFDGRLPGIEVFSAGRRLHPDLLGAAERIDRVPSPPNGESLGASWGAEVIWQMPSGSGLSRRCP
ncbi:DUF2283 domain-containing protein [Streptomyces sp. NPDC056222]|uniref:DUF2283 domain-containing protein n=1 Tax=Streptomyces sp. NPDC056222 TaxID=3345749 RepID=UPI0035E2FAEE